MGKAVEYFFALLEPGNGGAVIFLVKEEPRFLAVLYIHIVFYADV